MVRRLLATCVMLTGCQIIINHNTFTAEPADDAAIDAPLDTSDAPLAVNAVTTPATTPRIIAGALIGFIKPEEPYIVVQDGHWIDRVTTTGTSTAQLDLAGVFATAPRCFCEAIGGNNIDCSLTAATTKNTVSFGLWDRTGNVGRQVSILCVGDAESGAAGELRWTGNGQALLAGARFDTQFHVNPIDAQDGATPTPWITGNQNIFGTFTPATFTTPFVDQPTCDQNVVALDLVTSKAVAIPTRRYVAPFISPGGGSPTALAIEVICLGGIGGVGNAVVSPANGGATFATATLNTDGSVESKDGDWIESQVGEFLNLKTGVFGGAPRCTCTLESPNFSVGEICGVHAEPTANQIMLRRYNVENGNGVARRAHVACLGN